MANQITHLYYAEKIYDKFLKDKIKIKKEFFIGALFPDVRYVSGINKAITHFYCGGWDGEFDREKIYINENDSDFMCGVKIHNFIDYVHTKVIRGSKDFHDIHETLGHLRVALLILEDITHSKKLLYLNDYKDFFDKTLKDETDFNINIKKEHIDKWHELLKQYLFNNADEANYLNFSLGIACFSEESIRDDMERYNIIKEDIRIVGIIKLIEEEINKTTIDDLIKI